MKHKSLSTVGVLAGFLCAAVLSLASARPLRAESAIPAQTLNLNAGQTQIIDHLKKDAKPTVHVVANPDAMVMHDETPGQVLLLGVERGQWDVTVTREDGSQVAYHVVVAAIADHTAPLDPATGPLPSPDAKASQPTNYAADQLSSTHLIDPSSYETDALPETAPTDNAPAPVQPKFTSQNALEPIPTPPGSYRTDPQAIDNTSVSSASRTYLPSDVISLMSGASEIYDFPRRLKRISIADSTVADVQVTNPYQLNLIGHRPGFTTLAVWDDKGHYQQRQVRVDEGGKQQVMLNAVVAELDRSKLENQGIDVALALANPGISLSSLPGGVATPYGPTSQLTAGTGAVPGVAPPGGQLLPLLLSSTMTYGLATTGSNMSTQSLFEFLETNNLGRILAEPHLLANSGQSASFLSGGEIPIVLAQALNTSIVFKEFGTKINCRPTVIGKSDIELLVKTEVSEPDYAHGVALFGFQVPAFVTRKAETLVRLKDGQTLIIAGLILRNRNAVVNKVPYLGDLPYAGGLFRNTQWQDSTTDLVMSVRPEIVAPLPTGAQVFEPSERGPMTADEIRTQPLSEPDASRPRF
jgi:Flp pilus assembly secretin CpaC